MQNPLLFSLVSNGGAGHGRDTTARQEAGEVSFDSILAETQQEAELVEGRFQPDGASQILTPADVSETTGAPVAVETTEMPPLASPEYPEASGKTLSQTIPIGANFGKDAVAELNPPEMITAPTAPGRSLNADLVPPVTTETPMETAVSEIENPAVREMARVQDSRLPEAIGAGSRQDTLDPFQDPARNLPTTPHVAGAAQTAEISPKSAGASDPSASDIDHFVSRERGAEIPSKPGQAHSIPLGAADLSQGGKAPVTLQTEHSGRVDRPEQVVQPAASEAGKSVRLQPATIGTLSPMERTTDRATSVVESVARYGDSIRVAAGGESDPGGPKLHTQTVAMSGVGARPSATMSGEVKQDVTPVDVSEVDQLETLPPTRAGSQAARPETANPAPAPSLPTIESGRTPARADSPISVNGVSRSVSVAGLTEIPQDLDIEISGQLNATPSAATARQPDGVVRSDAQTQLAAPTESIPQGQREPPSPLSTPAQTSTLVASAQPVEPSASVIPQQHLMAQFAEPVGRKIDAEGTGSIRSKAAEIRATRPESDIPVEPRAVTDTHRRPVVPDKALGYAGNPFLLEALAENPGDSPEMLREAIRDSGSLQPIRGSESATTDVQARGAFRQVAAALSDRVSSNPSGTLDLRLAPEELGKLRIAFTTGETGLNVIIQADRPETLELFRRNIEQFSQDLKSMGYEDVTMSFGSEGQSGDDQPDWAEYGTTPVGSEETALSAAQAPLPESRHASASGLDLRL